MLLFPCHTHHIRAASMKQCPFVNTPITCITIVKIIMHFLNSQHSSEFQKLICPYLPVRIAVGFHNLAVTFASHVFFYINCPTCCCCFSLSVASYLHTNLNQYCYQVSPTYIICSFNSISWLLCYLTIFFQLQILHSVEWWGKIIFEVLTTIRIWTVFNCII